MAPINEQNSYSTYSSSSTMKPFSCMCRHSLDDDWEWFLPITRRGHFFQDSFFENTRSLFDGAVRDVLGRWGDTSMLTDSWNDNSTTLSNLNRYRQLRSHNMRDENQAVTVSSDFSSYKIVLDVHEFTEGEIKVKVIAEKEVHVEGVMEEKDAGHSASKKRFSRRFPLAEDSDVDGISSVMSSDGILTITVPKKASSVCHENLKKVDHKVESSNNASRISNNSSSSTQESCQSTSTSTRDTETGTAAARYCENCYKKLHSEKKLVEGTANEAATKIPVSINSSVTNNSKSSVSTESQKAFESNTATEKSMSSSTNSQLNSSLKHEKSTFSNQSQVRVPSNDTEKCASETKNFSDTKNFKDSLQETDCSSRHVPISVNFRPLPIMRRGLFFNDSIFENARNDFQSAVREVLTKWGERSSILDDLSSYRSLRTRDLREENQAIKVKEDETTHKFILDVHDFMNGGEVNVKAINERELVVEGQIEKQEGGSKSVKRFYKRFVVPGDIILESVTSVMSSDGVLTITAPKKAPTIHICDITSPVSSDKIQEGFSHCNQEVIAKNHKTSQASGSKIIQESSESSSTSQKVQELSSARQNNTTKEHVIHVQVEGRENDVHSGETVKKVQCDSQISLDNFAPNDSTTSFSKESSVMSEKSTKSESSMKSSLHETQSSTDTIGSQETVEAVNADQQRTCNVRQNLASVGRLLPISRKGNFFSDTFFEDSRQSFHKAVKNVLKTFNENSQSDDLTAYRSLRHRSLSQENQALNIHEDEHSHKVVIDAKDFVDGDITVSVVGERELLIEGQSENKDVSSSSSHTFSRRFLLPDSVDIHSITSAISSDGILTVDSVKKGASNNCKSQVQKMSNEARSRHENHNGSGRNWEEQSVKESSEQSDGYSCRSYSTSYRGHHEHSSSNVF